MIKFKIRNNYYRIIDGYNISESSREVKFSNIKIDFTNKTILDLPIKYQECQLVDVDNNNNINEIIFTGYVNNYILPKMKNKIEDRELEIELLTPLAIATLRTADAVGTYNLQSLIREIIQPLIDDGFILKELNIGNNQITVNYLTETIESALNKLSNKFNFWWYIDKNKNIYINDINYIFSKKEKLIYDDNNKISGLIDFIPSMESIDYCNTIDFTNVRLITKSNYIRDYTFDYSPEDSYYKINYYNPIFNKEYINSGEEIEFDIPFIINSERKGLSQTMDETYNTYFRLQKIVVSSGGAVNYETLVDLTYDENNQIIIPNNATISDSYSDEKEFVFVRDGFFKNLIVGMKYNGNNQISVGKVYSETGLMWAKIRINDNKEIEINKDKISNTGIIEKQINMNEQWKTFEEILESANSLIKNNVPNVENIKMVTDEEHNLNIGDIININKEEFFTEGKFIITDKNINYESNYEYWEFTLRNTNILESYIDLFRSSEKQQEEKSFNLITGDYSQDGIKETYEVEVL